MADDEKDWQDVVPKKAGAATAVADDEWEDVRPVAKPGDFQTKKGGPIINASGLTEKGAAPAPEHTAAGTVREGLMGLSSGFTGMPETAHPIKDWWANLKAQEVARAQRPVFSWDNLKDAARSGMPGIGVAEGLAGGIGEMGKGAYHLNPEQFAHGVGSTAGQAIALGVIPEIASEEGAVRGAINKIPAVQNAKNATALALRTEEGALKPEVRATARLAGGVAGGGLGHLAGVAPEGAVAGYAAGPALANRLIPNLPTDIPTKTPIGAHLPAAEEFYENKGGDLLKRGKEQASIDKTAEREQTAQEKALAKEGKAVPITQGPYYNQHLEALKTQAEAAKPKIVSPTEGEPRVTGSEGRPATWTNEFVQEQAGKGNRDAIAQAVRRGLDLPTNARYVMGDPDFPRAVLNPREVTLFSPEGTPIRNKANAQAEANQGTIPTISRTPRGRIPEIGEQNAPQATVVPQAESPLAAKPPVDGTPAPVAAAEQPKTAKDRSARIARNIASLEQGLSTKAGKIPSIGQPQTGAFKVPAMKPIVPPAIEPVLKETNWQYLGKDATGMHTLEEPGTHIKVRLLDRELNPEFIRRKISEKEKQFGGPRKTQE